MSQPAPSDSEPPSSGERRIRGVFDVLRHEVAKVTAAFSQRLASRLDAVDRPPDQRPSLAGLLGRALLAGLNLLTDELRASRGDPPRRRPELPEDDDERRS